MKNIKLSVVLDSFFVFVSALLFFYALFLYGIGGFKRALILSSVIAILISAGVTALSLIKGEASYKKQDDIRSIKAFNYTLLLNDFSDNIELLAKYYATLNKVIVRENYLILEDENKQIIPLFSSEKISLTDLLNAVKKYNCTFKKEIIAIAFSDELYSFIEEAGLDVTLTKSEELFKKLKKTNVNFKLIKVNEIKKKRLLSVMKEVFTKSNYKRFFISGIIITSASFFSFYPLYYIIFGGALILTSVILKFFGKEKIKA